MNTYVIAFGITTAWLVGTEASDSPIQPGVAYVFFNQSTFQRPADSGIQSDIRMETKGVDFGWLWLGKTPLPAGCRSDVLGRGGRWICVCSWATPW